MDIKLAARILSLFVSREIKHIILFWNTQTEAKDSLCVHETKKKDQLTFCSVN